MTTPDRAAQHYLQRLEAAGVPAHLHGGLVDYLVRGIAPGRFLRAVLENSLSGAFAGGDRGNRAGLDALMEFIFYDVPSSAWGSPAVVQHWCDTFQNTGAHA